MLLAIDSSAGTSVALVDDRLRVLAEASEADGFRHAEVIGALIRDVLASARVSPDSVTGVAMGVGPGPFTGLRVGMAAAHAFAAAIDVPLIGVVSHDAIAAERYAEGASRELLVVTDARRREVYWSRYSGVDGDGLPVRHEGPSIAKPDDLPAHPDRIDAATVSAASVGRLGQLLSALGRATSVEPLYLRSPDVTLSTPKRVS